MKAFFWLVLAAAIGLYWFSNHYAANTSVGDSLNNTAVKQSGPKQSDKTETGHNELFEAKGRPQFRDFEEWFHHLIERRKKQDELKDMVETSNEFQPILKSLSTIRKQKNEEIKGTPCTGKFVTSWAVELTHNRNILVFGEDVDRDTVPQSSRVFTRVITELQGPLSSDGFNVYDETAITLDSFKPGVSRRSNAELIDIARSMTRPSIDAVVVFTIYASLENQSDTSEIHTHITGRILNVQSGQIYDYFEVNSGNAWNVPTNCDRECVLESVGDKAKILGEELGAVLAEKLDWLLEGQDNGGTNDMVKDYYLELNGFSVEDYMDIEQYLVIFSGYWTHRPIEQRHTSTIVLYRSRIGTAKLSRNLDKMLDELDMRAMLTVEGNTYTLTRINRRNETLFQQEKTVTW